MHQNFRYLFLVTMAKSYNPQLDLPTFLTHIFGACCICRNIVYQGDLAWNSLWPNSCSWLPFHICAGHQEDGERNPGRPRHLPGHVWPYTQASRNDGVGVEDAMCDCDGIGSTVLFCPCSSGLCLSCSAYLNFRCGIFVRWDRHLCETELAMF